jgi:hypothetical protein
MDLRKIGWGGMDWIDLGQDRDRWTALVNTVMNLRVPQNVGKFFSTCPTGGFSRRTQLYRVSCRRGSCFKVLHRNGKKGITLCAGEFIFLTKNEINIYITWGM